MATYDFSDYHRDKVPEQLKGRRYARNHTKIAGLRYRTEDVLRFIAGVVECEKQRWSYGVTLRREPNNSHDPLALAIDGYWTAKSFLLKHQFSASIGYVPADWAKSYSQAVDDGAVLAAQLKNCWIGDEGGIAIDIAIYRSLD